MKIDFGAVVSAMNGQPILMDEKPLTVGFALRNAVLTDTEANKATKLKRYDLYLKLTAGEDTYTAEEASTMKAAVLDSYATIVAGQLAKLLDG